MQNSELFRRGLIFAMDENAKIALIENNVSENSCVSYYEIVDSIFYEIYKSGVFYAINRELGSCIDDYEEEIVSHDQLYLVIDILEKYAKTTKLKEINEMALFVRNAVEYKASVYFIL